MPESWFAKKLRQAQIADEIEAERDRQDEKFGEQWEMPLVSESHYHEMFAREAESWKVVNGNTARDFIGMLLEEAYEAGAESDPAAMRAELIQVLAVAMKMVERIDRETGK